MILRAPALVTLALSIGSPSYAVEFNQLVGTSQSVSTNPSFDGERGLALYGDPSLPQHDEATLYFATADSSGESFQLVRLDDTGAQMAARDFTLPNPAEQAQPSIMKLTSTGDLLLVMSLAGGGGLPQRMAVAKLDPDTLDVFWSKEYLLSPFGATLAPGGTSHLLMGTTIVGGTRKASAIRISDASGDVFDGMTYLEVNPQLNATHTFMPDDVTEVHEGGNSGLVTYVGRYATSGFSTNAIRDIATLTIDPFTLASVGPLQRYPTECFSSLEGGVVGSNGNYYIHALEDAQDDLEGFIVSGTWSIANEAFLFEPIAWRIDAQDQPIKTRLFRALNAVPGVSGSRMGWNQGLLTNEGPRTHDLLVTWERWQSQTTGQGSSQNWADTIFRVDDNLNYLYGTGYDNEHVELVGQAMVATTGEQAFTVSFAKPYTVPSSDSLLVRTAQVDRSAAVSNLGCTEDVVLREHDCETNLVSEELVDVDLNLQASDLEIASVVSTVVPLECMFDPTAPVDVGLERSGDYLLDPTYVMQANCPGGLTRLDGTTCCGNITCDVNDTISLTCDTTGTDTKVEMFRNGTSVGSAIDSLLSQSFTVAFEDEFECEFTELVPLSRLGDWDYPMRASCGTNSVSVSGQQDYIECDPGQTIEIECELLDPDFYQVELLRNGSVESSGNNASNTSNPVIVSQTFTLVAQDDFACRFTFVREED